MGMYVGTRIGAGAEAYAVQTNLTGNAMNGANALNAPEQANALADAIELDTTVQEAEGLAADAVSAGFQAGVGAAQTAAAGLEQQGQALAALQDLATQAAEVGQTAEQRFTMNVEAQGLLANINQIAQNTQFDGVALLDGGAGTVQFGPEGAVTIETAATTTAALGVDEVDLTTQETAEEAGERIEQAAQTVGQYAATMNARGAELAATVENMPAGNNEPGAEPIREFEVAAQSAEQFRQQVMTGVTQRANPLTTPAAANVLQLLGM